MSARSVSDCELTDTYSPAAIDIPPATSPAPPAINTAFWFAAAAATPAIKLAVEMMPSLAPRTAARIHPMRPTRCFSGCMRKPLIQYHLLFRSTLPEQTENDNDYQNGTEECHFSCGTVAGSPVLDADSTLWHRSGHWCSACRARHVPHLPRPLGSSN